MNKRNRGFIDPITLAMGLGAIAVVGLGAWGIYQLGSSNATKKMEAKWAVMEGQYQDQITEAKNKVTQATDAHKLEVGELNDRITANSKIYAANLADAALAHAGRMRKSENRVQTYIGLSEAGAAERRYLADHAAKLDRALEEGRHLVHELRTTLGQRDSEIIELANYIQSLLKLTNNQGTPNESARK